MSYQVALLVLLLLVTNVIPSCIISGVCRRPSFVVIRLPVSSRVAYHGVLLFRVVFALFRVVVVVLVLVHVVFNLSSTTPLAKQILVVKKLRCSR